MKTLSIILPIFIIIAAGWLARKRHFIPESFIGPANRIVYYFAIPAMIFRAVSTASFHDEFSSRVLMITLVCIAAMTLIAWGVAIAGRLPGTLKGTFIQSSFHGNLGYIGLAVVFYSLGDAGLASGAIFAGFIMIVQNILAVAVLQIHSDIGVPVRANLKRIIGHPVILSACGGIGFSLLEIPLPVIAERSLGILSGMALPLALLLIGATLSFDLMRVRFKPMLAASLLKLLALPGLGLLIFTLFSLPVVEFLPAFILLASPTATLTFVMAKEMNGDPDFAVAAISGCTLLSGVSFSVWLHFLL
ncbi:MAG: AEC family transporter [Proteobacteria bacterium]|nr:AEC family transporter [Desulfobacula sp.]MBU3951637.1 AEC family transporter [Pseudomonadota bacterium]MBU4132767.1 AEC family transporter [Pseudomonadota bacterium]